VTVIGPKAPTVAPPTEMPAPKSAVEVPFTQCVKEPSIATVRTCPGEAEDGLSEAIVAAPLTVKPLISEGCSLPVCTEMVRAPSAALFATLTMAVAVVALVTVTGPKFPCRPEPMEIPGPKLATVVPCTKCVPDPVIVTVMDCAGKAEFAMTDTMVAGPLAAVTVNVVLPMMLPIVALIVVLPAFSADDNPPLLIVAVAVFDETHVTLAVRFCVEPSLKVPVAVNCCVPPATTDGFTGVTAMDFNVAAVTVRVVLPTIAPSVAEIDEVPAFNADAKPELLIVAVAVVPDAQVTCAVRFCVELSL
jgi:hypothetical protein